LEFARDLPSGKLRFANAIWQPSGAVAVLGVWGSKQLAISPDDRHVMTFGRRIGLFSRFPKASALVARGVQDTSAITAPSRPDWQWAAISPDGKGLFVYGYQERAVDESKLGVFARHATMERWSCCTGSAAKIHRCTLWQPYRVWRSALTAGTSTRRRPATR
jgi:hypothetical protein